MVKASESFQAERNVVSRTLGNCNVVIEVAAGHGRTRPSGVTVNAICPGFVATPLTEKVASDPVRAAALAKRTMVGRNGEPTDFAGTVVFLASPASDFITGQTIFVDGGFSVT